VIPQSFIQELLARVDIVEVVGRSVKLRKAGANFLGLCPFHGEKSPSFTVSPTKQFYHCFGCGVHGSAVGFLMEQAGLGYVDAIHELARSAGLTVPQESSPGDAVRRDPDLLETLAAAAKFYKSRLREASAAIDYLKGRGVSGETAARYGIGYAPDGWRGLEAAVPDYSASALVATGLVIESEPDADADGADSRGAGGPREGQRRRRYDRFRDRIMFPIRNPRGQVIGFGGRVMGKGEPKYLNSPETALFSKGRELYGLFEARDAIRAADCVIVVEGYMDVVMLAQHGVRNAVATLGTATTALHAHKLLRLVDRVVFAFDGDAAGRRAAWRALEGCLPHAADTKRIDFLFLPAEHDPDSFVRAHGAEGFAAQLAATQPLSEFLLRELSSRVDLSTPEGRARLQAEARPLLLALPPAALRMQLVQALATRVGIRAEDLLRFIQPDAPVQRATASRAEAGGRGNTNERPGWARDRAARQSEWAASRDWRRMPAMQAVLPDLQRRARLLLALHPFLAQESWSNDLLPESIIVWKDRLATLPSGASFAALIESIREPDAQLAAALEAEAAADRGLMSDLDPSEARRELEGALNQLRLQRVREEIDRLAAGGLLSEADRKRYADLQSMRKALTSG
jgi:DNA primase